MSISDFGKEKNLILTVNKYGEIIQFDIECQKITGFSREEALHKKIWDLLIPYPYIKQWKKMMVSSFLEEGVNDIRIPWKTKQGNEVLIILNSFPFKDQTGTVDNICFMGKKISNVWNKKQNDETKIEPDGGKKMDQETKKSNFVFTKPPLSQRLKETKKPTNTPPKKIFSPPKNQFVIPLDLEVDDKELPIQNQKQFTKKIQELSDKYDEISKKQKILMRSNRKLERKNKQLTKKIQNSKQETKTFKKSTQEKQQETQHIKNDKFTAEDSKRPKKRKLGIGWKKKQIELDTNIQNLNEREKNLQLRQQKLDNERKNFDKRIAELSTWKQKLEQLEIEIEKRRIAVVNKEKNLQEEILTNQQKNQDTIYSKEKQIIHSTSKSNVEPTSLDEERYFDTITISAGIIQRGIFKKVNTFFQDMLGYSMNEIIDKSIIDFIAPEGLPNIENYYISRLKGSNESSLQTVVLTSKNEKIPVRIEFKPYRYKGINAELMTVSNINK